MKKITNTMKVYKPSEAMFFKRVISSCLKPIVLLALSVMIIVGIIYRDSGLKLTMIMGLAFLLYIFLLSLYRNIFYLRSITIDKEKKFLSLEINKYNRVIEKMECKNTDLNIELREVVIIYESYYLIINDVVNNRRVLKQASVGGWNKKLFSEIVKEIDALN